MFSYFCGSSRRKVGKTKAVLLTQPGPADQAFTLQDVPMYQLQAHEVRVKVQAIGINPVDIMMREGYANRLMHLARGPQEASLLLGRDASGVVEEVGSGVLDYKVGDQVWVCRSTLNPGTYAERIAAEVSEISRKPTSLSHTQAASLPFVAITAWLALVDTAKVIDPFRPESGVGKKVFINGGAGPLGLFAAQFLRHYGCDVGISASPQSLSRLSSTPFFSTFSQTLDHTQQDFGRELENQCDVVLDGVGDPASEMSALRALRPGGHYVSLRGRMVKWTDQTEGLLSGVLNGAMDLSRAKVEFQRSKAANYDWVVNLAPPRVGRDTALRHVAKLVDEGVISPMLSDPLQRGSLSPGLIASAHQQYESRASIGKVVVELDV